MTQKQFEGIVVNGEELALEVAYGNGDKVLDLGTGKIVLAQDCPENDIGKARLALQQGKRFVRIPVLDEVHMELKARFDNWESGNYADSDELLPEGGMSEMVREVIKPALEAVGSDPGYTEYCEHLHDDLAAEGAALGWIISLEPNVMVGWWEEGLGLTRVYDPAVKAWEDAM